jgi:hypothetical protein
MIWPIFIPSKGRSNLSTFQHIPDATIVVEPQDHTQYLAVNPNANYLVLPENNRGISYVRNFILDYNRSRNIEWYWMLDDDISGLFVTENKRVVRKPSSEVLKRAQDIISSRPGIGQAALEYAQYAWSATNLYRENSYCDVCVAINIKRTMLCQYRSLISLKEDRDFTLQVLSNGSRTLRLSQLSFKTPKNGSNDGGLKPLYQQKTVEAVSVEKMIELWGREICQPVTKKDGRYDVKINWSYFK